MKGLTQKLDLSAAWKKYRLVALVLLLGFVLMLLPGGNDKEETSMQTQTAEVFSLEDTERRMAEKSTEESAEEGSVERKKETVTVNRGSGYEDVVITQQVYPAYQGAVVVCQGGDKAAVRLAITEAVAALTGLSSDKISVVKWNS